MWNDEHVSRLQEMRAPYACMAESHNGDPEGEVFAACVAAIDAAIRALSAQRPELPVSATLTRPESTAGGGGECTCPSGDGSLRWPCPKHTILPSTAANGGEKVK